MSDNLRFEFYQKLYEAALEERNLFYTRIQMMITIEAILAGVIAYCMLTLPATVWAPSIWEIHVFLTLTVALLLLTCASFAVAIYFTIRSMHNNRHGMLREPEHYERKDKRFAAGLSPAAQDELFRKHIIRHLIGAGTESANTNDKRRVCILRGNDFLVATFVLICLLAYPLRRVQLEFPVVQIVRITQLSDTSFQEQFTCSPTMIPKTMTTGNMSMKSSINSKDRSKQAPPRFATLGRDAVAVSLTGIRHD